MSDPNQSPSQSPQQMDQPSPHAQPQPNSIATRMLLPVDRSKLAVITGYCGLLGLFFIPAIIIQDDNFLLSIPAIIAMTCGVSAIKEIKKSQQTSQPKYGMGRAIFGIVIGVITLLLYGVIILNELGLL